MQLFTYALQLTGLDVPTLAKYVAFQDVDGVQSVKYWNVPGVAQPTQDELNTALAAPEPVVQSILTAYAEKVRETLASVGTTVNVDPSASTAKNIFAATDSASLTLLSGTLQYVQLNTSATVGWTGNGVTTALTAAEIQVLAVGVFAFVQSTFALKTTILIKIKAGTITTTDQIDAAFAAASSTSASTPS